MQRLRNHLPLALALAFTILLGLAQVHQAKAHAYLLRSDPPANAILETAPDTINLWFSEIISQGFSSAQLINAAGESSDVSVTVDPNDQTLMIVHLPELADGVYSLRWKAHSDVDGHFSYGLFIFGVGQNADLSTATAVETDTAVPWPELLLRWLTFITYAGLIGAFAVTWLVLKPEAQPEAIAAVQQAAQKRILRLAWWSSLGAFLISFAWLLWQAYVLADSSGTLSITSAGWQWLSQTRLGIYWWARQLVLLLLIVSLRTLRQRETAGRGGLTALTGFLLLGLVLIQSLTSHAAAVTPNTALAVVMDALHLTAASFWVGGLLALAGGLLPLVRRRADFSQLVKSGWRPFSLWAALSVGVLVATGIYSTGQQVSSANALVTTFYGRTLIGKIGLMLLVGLIGLINSSLLHPRLAAPLARLLHKPDGWTPLSLRQFPRLVTAEIGAGLVVFLLAGLLTAAPTARGAAYTAAADDLTTRSQTIDDVFITLSINPAQAGQNIFTVRAVSTRRPPPADILRVLLRFTYLEEDLGLTSEVMNEFEPDLYILSGSQLYLPGRWQIDVVVRRQGVEDSVARFNWVIPEAGPEVETVLSKEPWETQLTWLAGILLLLVVTAVFWGFRRAS